MKMKSIGISVAVLLIAVLSFPFIYDRSTKIDQKYPGVIYSIGQDEMIKKTDIQLTGEKHRYLFKKDLFTGTLKIGDASYKVRLSKEGHHMAAVLTKVGNKKYIRSVGSVMASPDLSRIWVDLDKIDNEYSQKCEKQCPIVGPAKNKAEALAILKQKKR